MLCTVLNAKDTNNNFKKTALLKKKKVSAFKQLLALVNMMQEYKGKPFIHKILLLFLASQSRKLPSGIDAIR